MEANDRLRQIVRRAKKVMARRTEEKQEEMKCLKKKKTWDEVKSVRRRGDGQRCRNVGTRWREESVSRGLQSNRDAEKRRQEKSCDN